MLSFCLGFFPPSQTMEPYLRQYLRQYSSNSETEFFEVAKACDLKMRSVKKHGARQCSPTNDELLITQGRPLFVKPIFPDDSVKTFEVHSATTMKDLIDSICTKLNLEHPEDFALYLSHQDKETMVFGNDYLMDAISNTEIPVDKEPLVGGPSAPSATLPLGNRGKGAPEQMIIPYKLYFRRFLWPRSQEVNFANEAFVNIIFAQTASRLRKDEVRCGFADALLFSATAIRLASRDSSKTVTQKEEFYQPFLLSSQVKTLPIKEWVTQIDEAIAEMENLKNHDIKSNFVRRVLSWPTFGDSHFLIHKPVSLFFFFLSSTKGSSG